MILVHVRANGLVRAVLVLAALCSAALGGSARAQPGTPTPEATPGPGDCTSDLGIVRSAKTCVNVVHASPDAGPVDVYLDGERMVEGLPFGQASGFLTVPAGDHRLRVAPAGADVSEAVLDVPALELVAARAYEVAAIGPLSTIAAEVYDVDVYAIPGDARAGMTRLRVVHVSPEAPPIDVTLVGGDIAQRLDAGLAFPDAGAYRELSAGTYRLLVNAAGTSDAVLSDPSATFGRDTVTSVYLLGSAGDSSLQFLFVGTRVSRLPAPATPSATPPA